MGRVVDLFDGCGGWAEGARALGLHPIGIELNRDACASSSAAGGCVIRADVTELDPARFRPVEGLIASPPCPDFSTAGKRAGIEGETGRLMREVPRWVEAIRPRWVACEQVPPALEWWERFAHDFTKLGYRCWTGILNAADYGIVSACPLHDTAPVTPAESAERASRTATERVFALGTMTPLAAEPRRLALTVVARLVNPIERAYVGAATCDERLIRLLSLAQSERQIHRGRVGVEWTSAVTSAFGLMGATAESIAWWLRDSSDDLCDLARSSITSMDPRTTTIQAISRSIAATLITGLHTGPASRTDGCGLCVDVATPQTRQRAFLLASLDRQPRPPEPTHTRHPMPGLFGDDLLPWVSMAAALGWGMVDDPAWTLATGTKSGGADSLLQGGSGSRKSFAARLAAGIQPVSVATRGDSGRSNDSFDPSNPSRTLTGKSDSWVVQTGNNSHVTSRTGSKAGEGGVQIYERSVDEPAPTLDAKVGGAWRVVSGSTVAGGPLAERGVDEPAFTVTSRTDLVTLHTNRGQDAEGNRQTRATDEPAPSFTGKAGPQWEWGDGTTDGSAMGQGIKLTVRDALILQSFRPEYPLHGNKTSQFRQVGNAVPPLLAQAVLSSVLDNPGVTRVT